jgi:hypothetical protein
VRKKRKLLKDHLRAGKCLDLEMLSSKKAMKAANIKLDFAMDDVEAFGKKMPIRFSSSGHSLLDLQEGGVTEHVEISVEEIQVLLVSFETDSEADKKRRINPDRLAVAMPMASEFNQLLAVDLKILYEGEKRQIPCSYIHSQACTWSCQRRSPSA